MTIDRASAEEISALLQQASVLCNESLKVVKVQEGLGHISVYGRLVGLFLGHSYTNILAPIWQTYPDLEPQEMKEPYVESVPSLSAESQAAISAFAEQASKSIVRIEELLKSHNQTDHLPFGGFPEVARSVTEVQAFLAKPRFRDEEPR